MSTWPPRAVRANCAATRPATTRPSSGPPPPRCTGRARACPWPRSRPTRESASARSTVTSPPGKNCSATSPTSRSSRCWPTLRPPSARRDRDRGAAAVHRGGDQPAQRARAAAARRTALDGARRPAPSSEQVHQIIQQIIDRGRADGTIRQDVTPRDIVAFGAMLAQPRASDPGWDATCRRLLATYLAGLGTPTPITTSTTLPLPAPAPARPRPDRHGRSNVHTLVEVISRRCEPSDRVSGLDHEAARRTGQLDVGSAKDASSGRSAVFSLGSRVLVWGACAPGPV